jgi:hypothetical protein
MSTYPDDGADAPLGREPLAAPGPTATQHYTPPQPYPQQYGHQYQQPHVYGYGMPRMRRQYPIETKPFFLTSEFVGAVLAIAGIAITAAASDAFGAWRAWILITAVVVGYMVSRGIAKSGTRSNASDPREHMELPWGRPDANDDRS